MRRIRTLGFIMIVAVLLCVALAFCACDDMEDDTIEELVAGKNGDLSMYEVCENYFQNDDKFVIKKVKDEYKDKIATAIIPGNVYCTDWNAFEGCKNLKKIIVQEGVNFLGRESFKDCKKLESIELYDGFSSIYKGMFMNCTSLEEVVLPDSVRYIETDAFKGCTKLKSIKMSDGVLIVGGAFDDTALCDNVIDGMVYINNIAYKYAGNMPKNTTYKLKEGTINAASHVFSNCDGLKHLVLPDSMEYIPSALAFECKNLLSLTIGRNFKKIEYITGAWWRVVPVIDYSPRLVEVYNRSDIEMSKEFFYTIENGDQMEILHIYDDTGHSALETRDNGQVYLVTDAEKVLVECTTDSDCVQIESGTTAINRYAFCDCENLKEIIIPEGVTDMSFTSVVNCPNLTSITVPTSLKCFNNVFSVTKDIEHLIKYLGTMEQWNSLEKNIYSLTYTVICSDGTINVVAKTD